MGEACFRAGWRKRPVGVSLSRRRFSCGGAMTGFRWTASTVRAFPTWRPWRRREGGSAVRRVMSFAVGRLSPWRKPRRTGGASRLRPPRPIPFTPTYASICLPGWPKRNEEKSRNSTQTIWRGAHNGRTLRKRRLKRPRRPEARRIAERRANARSTGAPGRLTVVVRGRTSVGVVVGLAARGRHRARRRPMQRPTFRPPPPPPPPPASGSAS